MKKVKPQIYVYSVLVVILLAVAGFFASDVRKSLNKGIDLQGGYEIVFKIDYFDEKDDLPSDASVLKSVQNRLVSLGFSDATAEYDGKNIRVKVGSDKSLDEVVQIISTTSKLTFRDATDVLITDASILVEGGASVQYQGETPVVVLRVKNNETFYQLTYALSQQSNKLMVTWLDFEDGVDSYEAEYAKELEGETPKYVSAALVTSGISGDAVISGDFTAEQAQNLVNLINAGSLPVKLTKVYSTSFDSVVMAKSGNNFLIVGAIALVAIMFVVILRYRLLGFTLAVIMPGLLLLSAFIYSSMGGLVNTNSASALVLAITVLIGLSTILFENIISEINLGKKLDVAYTNAKKNSLPVTVDAYAFVLVFSFLLYFFSINLVKSFATLLVTALACTIAASYVLRVLIGLLVKSNIVEDKKWIFGAKTVSEDSDEKKNKNWLANVNFTNIRKYCYAFSALVMIVAIVVVVVKPITFGTDFSGTTKLVVIAEEKIESEKVVKEIAEFGFKVSDTRIVDGSDKGIEVTFADKINAKDANSMISHLKTVYGENVNLNTSNPVTGRNVTESVLLLTGIALVIGFAYIAIRYGFDYGYSVLLITAHDILVSMFIVLATGLTIDSNTFVLILAVVSWSMVCGFIVSSFIKNETLQYKNEKRLKESLPQFANAVSKEAIKNGIWVIVAVILLVISSVSLMVNTTIFCYIAVLVLCLLVCAYSSIVLLPNAWVSLHKKTDENPKNKKTDKTKKRKKAELQEYVVPGINDIR